MLENCYIMQTAVNLFPSIVKPPWLCSILGGSISIPAVCSGINLFAILKICTMDQKIWTRICMRAYRVKAIHPRLGCILLFFLLDSICFRADDPQGPVMTPQVILLVCDEKNDIRCAASVTYCRLSSVHLLSFFVCSRVDGGNGAEPFGTKNSERNGSKSSPCHSVTKDNYPKNVYGAREAWLISHDWV